MGNNKWTQQMECDNKWAVKIVHWQFGKDYWTKTNGQRQMVIDERTVTKGQRQKDKDKETKTNGQWQMASDKWNVTNGQWQWHIWLSLWVCFDSLEIMCYKKLLWR
jgi:hypothetical protein